MLDRPSRAAHRLGVVVAALAVTASACGSDDSGGESDASAATAATTPATTTVADAPADDRTTTAPDTTSAPDTTVPETTAAPDTSPAPDTTAAPDTSPAPDTTVPPVVECRIVTDFDGADDALWVVVNDGVMGGSSEGVIEFGESEVTFSGTVVTAGGGFTSVRRPIDGELAGAMRLELRIRPDGRRYEVTLRSDAVVGNRSVSYDGVIGSGPVEGDGYQVVTVEFDDLRPTVFGTSVDAPPFDPDAATELGIIIADGVDGEFQVDIDWIDACP